MWSTKSTYRRIEDIGGMLQGESVGCQARSSSLIAAFAFWANSAGTSSMPCAVRACSATWPITSSSVSPRATKSQSGPTSLQHIFLDITFPPLKVFSSTLPKNRPTRLKLQRIGVGLCANQSTLRPPARSETRPARSRATNLLDSALRLMGDWELIGGRYEADNDGA